MFDHVDPDRLLPIAHSARMVSIRRGQFLFHRRDRLDTVFLVINGCLGCSLVSDEGRQIILRRLLPDDLIGEVEAITGASVDYDGVSLLDTRLLSVPVRQFQSLLGDADFGRKLIQDCAEQLHEIVGFAESVSLYSLETRLARLIVKLCDQVGRMVEDGILIDCPISQSEMGQMINASRPKINLQMRRWHCDEFIRLQRNRIVVLEPRVMTELARPG